MSNTVSAQHPAVVLRATYLHLRALLAIAALTIVGLTTAVLVLAINNGSTTLVIRAARVPSKISANPPANTGADHRGLDTAVLHPATSSYASALQYFHTHEQ